ncbi:hypothetical protein P43SY_007047 [Pythium insidiosum]|uniref:C2 NT-type domain-containing protein n=1 Tax=Pythium insidiosum TaxID=114742 RepID=A0AAD5LVA4_PYTIN|nr:hypothetical protein P43SY_007047 [Pythium insidiosum]
MASRASHNTRDTSMSSHLRGTSISSKTPRATTSSTSGAGGGGSSSTTVLVNLDIYLFRATIGRDISPEDQELLVLFRRNSKEVTSSPTRWQPDHVAAWNQHVGIQTSLLRPSSAARAARKGAAAAEFLPKEYDVVLVALPSHSAVALFSVDFADVVQTQRAGVAKTFRISPAKCRDLAATIEFEVVWEPAAPPAASISSLHSVPSLATTASTSLSLAGRRTTASVSSQSSELTALSSGECGDCRALRRRLDRKETQIVQLESFLKESQKRIDALAFENEELVVREQAETRNAGQYRALNMRLLQELEMAFQFCAQQMLQAQQQQQSAEQQAALFMFLPQFEFMERVKTLHAELERVYNTSADMQHESDHDEDPQQRLADAWRAFDVRAEMSSALERNQRLQRQLEFLSRSLVYEVQLESDSALGGRTKLQRTATDASATTSDGPSEGESSAHLGSSNGPAPVRNLTEQLNALERENFVLKGKLEAALASVQALETRSEVADTTSSTGRSSLDIAPAAMALAPAIDENETENAVLEELAQLRDDRQALQEQLDQTRAELDALREASATAASAAPATKATSPRSGLASSRVSTTSGGSAMGSDFLNKIYMDVGKAKIALEEKVKRLQQELAATREDNAKLQNELLLLAHQQATASASASASAAAPTSARFEEVTDEDEDGGATLAPTQWQELAQEREARIKVLDQELEFMRQHLTEKATQVTTLEAELASVRTTLAAAQKKVTQLEIRVEALEVENRELQERAESSAALAGPYGGSSSVSSLRESSTARDDEVAELTKQLKLARQEVMQLRYRSNNLESVHEKLEEALKEKKTLQVKLTTLEGQLYEQRSRTISGTNFTTPTAASASTSSTYDAAMIEELQRQLDQKSAQLVISQREAEALRREVTEGKPNDSTLVELEARVQRFSTELARLTERNDDQATRIHALSERVEKVTREKYELEGLMKELLREIDGQAAGDGDNEDDDVDDPQPSAAQQVAPKSRMLPEPLDMSVLPPPRRPSDRENLGPSPATAPPAAIPTSGRVLDRYTTAIRSSAGSTPTTPSAAEGPVAVPTRVVPKNRVASLIRNFSSASSSAANRVEVISVDESETDATTEDETEVTTSPTRRSTLGSAMKRVRKLDFRARQGSAPAPNE